MSEYACINCEEEWNLDPIYDEEGNPFCCEDCMAQYNDVQWTKVSDHKPEQVDHEKQL